MPRIYYNMDVYVYQVFRRGIIIRAAKSVDNLQRIVIQNGQPLLIKHCPKCRENAITVEDSVNERKMW